LAEDGDWLDVTIISDSPLLEHDAMFMMQQYERAKNRLLEKQARDERRIKLALEQGLSPEELADREAAEKEKRLNSEKDAKSGKSKAAKQAAPPAKAKATAAAAKTKATAAASKTKASAKGKNDDIMDVDDDSDDADDIF
jgi:membrane protein involved in colicin uptake